MSLSFNIPITGLEAYGKKFDSHSKNLAAAGAVAGRKHETFITSYETNNNLAGVEANSVRYINQEGVPIESSVSTYFTIGGQGLAPVSDQLSGGQLAGCRDCTFAPDENKNFKNNLGQYLQVFLTDPNGVPLSGNVLPPATTLTTLNVANVSCNPKATSNIDFFVKLSGEAKPGDTYQTSVPVYTSLGTTESVAFTWTKSANAPQLTNGRSVWTLTATDPNGATIGAPYNTGMTVEFDSNGAPLGYNVTGPNTSSPTPPNLSITWPANSGVANSTISLNLGTVGKTDGTFIAGSSFEVKKSNQDGYTAGDFLKIDFDKQGFGVVTFTNNQKLTYCRIPLLNCNNVNGVIETKPGVFSSGPNSGIFNLYWPGTSGIGELVPSTYEGSTTDSTSVYVNMIEDQNRYIGNLKAIESIKEMTNRLTQI